MVPPLHHVLEFSVWSFYFRCCSSHTSQRGTVVYLFDYRKFSQAHFLELGCVLHPSIQDRRLFLFPSGIGGSGTRLVALALGPFVRKYTATDIPTPVLLLRKNILSAPPPPASATVTVLNRALPVLRQVDIRRAEVPDVLLVVDRVFHPYIGMPCARDADRSRDSSCGPKTFCESSYKVDRSSVAGTERR
ncbi:hypothetical protein EDB85DRAFT_1462481 [Lactarius pseudohatsudake]|nr:hypothetical protein EDB85DRAFT_367725 [Lactarius pseudohatsudake]KAH9041215.1 hypothetical protein EDB85DRAFT_1462481 [Lactarius pseudohatsudake]